MQASKKEAHRIVQSIFSDSEITHYDKSGPRPKHAIMKMSEYKKEEKEPEANWRVGKGCRTVVYK